MRRDDNQKHAEQGGTQCGKEELGAPIVAQGFKNLTVSVKIQVYSQAFLSGLGIQHCCRLWDRSQMWLRSGVAMAWASAELPIWPLGWELPYAAGVAEKRKKKIGEGSLKEEGKKTIFN